MYIKTLSYPEYTPGTKVPDLCTFPTGTFQLTYDATFATVGAGDGFLFGFSPSINGPMSYSNNAAAGGSFGVPVSVAWNSKTAVQAAYLSYRPVSAEIYVEFIGSTFADQGYVVGWMNPRDATAVVLNNRTVAQVLALPYTRTYPLRNGIRVLWRPEDNTEFEFKNSITDYSFPNIGIMLVGAALATTAIKLRAVCNYEGIPAADTFDLVNSAPSPVDLNQLQQAFNFASNPYTAFSSFVESSGRFVPTSQQLLEGATTAAGMILPALSPSRAISSTYANSAYGNARRGNVLPV